MTSPAILDAETIADMAKALQPFHLYTVRSLREAVWTKAGFTAQQIARFDARAVASERLRRSLKDSLRLARAM